MKPRTIQFIGLLALLFPMPAGVETISGCAVTVVDGDTDQVLDRAQECRKIHLAGIDAPERKQSFGRHSKEYLFVLLVGELALVDWNKRDRYQRIVVKIIH